MSSYNDSTEQFNLETYEDDLLLNSQIENFFFRILRIPWDVYIENCDRALDKQIQVEFIVTSECNLKCEYCYLHRYKDQIIPKECRDHNRIISNLHKFMQYWIREGFDCNLDIFSGEIWQTDFGCQILEIIADYIINKGAKVRSITIPSNCSFIMYPEAKERIQRVIDSLRQHSSQLIFSASVDGQVMEDISRVPANKKDIGKKDRVGFYDDLFEFVYRNKFGFHPMLCAYTIEKQKESLEWWKSMFKRYNPNNWKFDFTRLMMLEVRNDDWTDEKIEAFKDFQQYKVDTLLNECFDGNVGEFVNTFLHMNELSTHINYNTLFMHQNDGSMGCSMARSLCVRLGDLAVVPCHRMGYEKFVYGHFLEDDEGNITGKLKANNVQMCAICNYSNLRNIMYGCNQCKIKRFCIRGCMGSQYEATGDPLACIESVCKFEKAKIISNLYNMERIGGIEYLRHIVQNYNVLKNRAIKKEDKNIYRNLELLWRSALDVLNVYDVWKSGGLN